MISKSAEKALFMIGGTVMCGEYDGLLYPIYSDIHVKLALAVGANKNFIAPEYQKGLYDRILETKDLLFQIRFPPSDVIDVDGFKQGIMYKFGKEIDSIKENINEYLPLDKKISNDFDNDEVKTVLKVLYNIDSIDFDFDTDHFYVLQNNIAEAFEKYDHVELSGGTDTIQYYATALSKDLAARKVFEGCGNNKKLFFISSMDSMEANLPHNAKLFDIADKLGKDPELSAGAYVLSSSDKDASRVYIHDPLNDFVKISSKLHDSFRSKEHVGYYENGEIYFNKNYTKPEVKLDLPEGLRGRELSSVAAPILHGTSLSEVVSVMGAYLKVGKAFDSIVLEFDPKEMVSGSKSFSHLEELVKLHSERGTRIVLNNFKVFNDRTGRIENFISENKFLANNFAKKLEVAGAVLTNRTTKDAVIDEMVSDYYSSRYNAKEVKLSHMSEGLARVMGQGNPFKSDVAVLGYVPTSKSMGRSFSEVGNFVKSLIVSGLPGNTLPSKVVDKLNDVFSGGAFQISFSENEVTHELPSGEKLIEGENESSYAAGASANKYATNLRPENAAKQFRGISVSGYGYGS